MQIYPLVVWKSIINFLKSIINSLGLGFSPTTSNEKVEEPNVQILICNNDPSLVKNWTLNF